MEDLLRRRWRALLAEVPVASPAGLDHDAADDVVGELLAAYAAPGRHYHTVEHLAAVLDALAGLTPGAAGAPTPATGLAAWFHDVVYDPHRGDNEARSAEQAAARLAALGVAPATIHEATRLIELTASHEVAPGDEAGAALMDADLSVLGAPEDVYDRYARDVRREYGHVAADTYRTGRLAVLHRFLDRPRIFRTPTGVERWEVQARANLRREIARLKDSGR